MAYGGDDGRGSESSDAEDDQAHSQKGGTMTMKDQLVALQQEDPECVFIVRKINKLGFHSPDVLRSHFQSYGVVKQVHVSHSRVKVARSQPHDEAAWRQRPAALGFVVMKDASTAARIVEAGEHVVNGISVLAQAFRRHDPAEPKLRGFGDGEKAPRKRRGPPLHEHREDSPECFTCGCTMAVSLGISTCQVCALRQRTWANRQPPGPPQYAPAPPPHSGAPPSHTTAPPPHSLAPPPHAPAPPQHASAPPPHALAHPPHAMAAQHPQAFHHAPHQHPPPAHYAPPAHYPPPAQPQSALQAPPLALPAAPRPY